MKLHTDCRYFAGSKPCTYHKKEGVLCESCTYYTPASPRILMIKLDSMGDVPRTTSLLPSLKEAYPAAYITWVTRRESVELLDGNPAIDEILQFETNAAPHLLSRAFDLILSLDATRDSAALCSMARGTKKLGFGLDDTGTIYPLNQGAEEWYFLGLNDMLKRQNRKTYQQFLLEICELPQNRTHPPQLFLDSEEIASGKALVKKVGLDPDKPIIGVNTGSGSRWKMKSLPFDSLKVLAEVLNKNYQLILLGGAQELDKNASLSRLTGVPNSGGKHGLREFACIINQCSLLITGDTLALHLALALQKKIVAFFGPTSPHEIELFSLGEKLFPTIDCLSCYRSSCEVNPTCAELIVVDEIVKQTKRLLTTA